MRLMRLVVRPVRIVRAVMGPGAGPVIRAALSSKLPVRWLRSRDGRGATFGVCQLVAAAGCARARVSIPALAFVVGVFGFQGC